jgi:hypothetical protein
VFGVASHSIYCELGFGISWGEKIVVKIFQDTDVVRIVPSFLASFFGAFIPPTEKKYCSRSKVQNIDPVRVSEAGENFFTSDGLPIPP